MVATLFSVQILRFFAAMLVLLEHMESRLEGFGTRYGVEPFIVGFNGFFGVQIFFIISGFIMVWIAMEQFGKPGAGGRFFLNRVVRIMPLYAAMTAVQIGWLWLVRNSDAMAATNLTWAHVVKSYLFVPYLNAAEAHRPLLEQGWTLNFEMFFYLVFAMCLLLPCALGLAACMGALLVLGSMPYDGWEPLAILTDPILYAFLIGMLLALARKEMLANGGLVKVPGLLWILGGLVLLHTALRHVVDPAALGSLIAPLVVGLAVLCRDITPKNLLTKAMVKLGDASYSMYLTHGFVLLVVGIAWRKIFGGQWLGGYTIVVVAGCLLTAYVVHRWFEMPVYRALKKKVGRR